MNRDRPVDPAPTDRTDPAHDVRAMLRRRGASVQPRGTFADIERRTAPLPGPRRTRALLAVAAAVALVLAVGGVLALDGGDRPGVERIDTADGVQQTTTPPSSSTIDPAEPTSTSTIDDGTATTVDRDAAGGTTTTHADRPSTSTTDGRADQPEVQPVTVDTRLTITGLDPLHLPMTLDAARAATGQRIQPDEDSGIDPANPCSYARIPGMDSLWFMLDGDRLVRIDVTGGPHRTAAGVRVGDSESQVLAAYGDDVTSEPHPYAIDADSRYLVVDDDARPDYEIVFSVHDGVVVDYRVGLTPYVGWIEGCA